MVATPELLTALGLTFEQFNYLMGLSGIIAPFTIFLIWSRGL